MVTGYDNGVTDYNYNNLKLKAKFCTCNRLQLFEKVQIQLVTTWLDFKRFDGNHGGRFSRGGGRSKMQCKICAKTEHDANVCYYRLNVMPTRPNQWRNIVTQPQPTSNFQNPWYSAGVSPQMAQQWMSLSQWRVLTFDFIPRPANSLFAGRQPQAYLACPTTGTSQHANSQWYVDSGVAHHVTNSVDHFLNNISTSGTDQVMLGNGQGLSITSIGNTTFPSAHKPHVTLTLNNLLLVPKITKNLISVSQFA